jgi:hypothetical protein
VERKQLFITTLNLIEKNYVSAVWMKYFQQSCLIRDLLKTPNRSLFLKWKQNDKMTSIYLTTK